MDDTVASMNTAGEDVDQVLAELFAVVHPTKKKPQMFSQEDLAIFKVALGDMSQPKEYFEVPLVVEELQDLEQHIERAWKKLAGVRKVLQAASMSFFKDVKLNIKQGEYICTYEQEDLKGRGQEFLDQ